MSKKTPRNWKTYEKFELLMYTEKEIEMLQKKIDRTESAIKTMARKLNMGKSYVKANEEVSHTTFCNDCKFDSKNCNEDISDCIKRARIYKKFNKVY